jgi:hypothetical protein
MPAHQVALAQDADDGAGIIDNRHAADLAACHQHHCVQQRRVRMYHGHVAGHKIARSEHGLV